MNNHQSVDMKTATRILDEAQGKKMSGSKLFCFGSNIEFTTSKLYSTPLFLLGFHLNVFSSYNPIDLKRIEDTRSSFLFNPQYYFFSFTFYVDARLEIKIERTRCKPSIFGRATIYLSVGLNITLKIFILSCLEI
ncbi:hypothetical protein ACJX0J_037535, partial [Zea mays]